MSITIPENEQQNNLTGKVQASPTKTFFVAMLTRDIALIDAVMDLIDNSIDGVHREAKKNNSSNIEGESIYNGFFTEINISENEFSIKDNCGGIPLDVAKHYAFKLGRSSEYQEDNNLETVGMYGIGMKRAIFKMGFQAEVFTWNEDDMFKVTIPEDWSNRPNDWTFNYEILQSEMIKNILSYPGTFLRISKLHTYISEQFRDVNLFHKTLSSELQYHYGYIIQQGFHVSLNGVKIQPLQLEILTSEPSENGSIKPYVYADKIDDVEVEVIIGFYRPLADEDEIKNQLEGKFLPSQSENAGITVTCNDRVVLYADKSFLTGWGEPPVPKYHTQFIAIAGVVHFRSKNPISLPVTTTKRGLDTSSAIYAIVKNKIKQGIKLFTDFTNHWKSPSPERTKLFELSQKIDALKPGQSKSAYVKLERVKKDEQGSYQIPKLPRPIDASKSRFVVISFSKEKDKVDELRKYFNHDSNKPLSEIGSWCFDEIYSLVEKDPQ